MAIPCRTSAICAGCGRCSGTGALPLWTSCWASDPGGAGPRGFARERHRMERFALSREPAERFLVGYFAPCPDSRRRRRTKMTKAELIRTIAAQTGFTQADTREILEHLAGSRGVRVEERPRLPPSRMGEVLGRGTKAAHRAKHPHRRVGRDSGAQCGALSGCPPVPDRLLRLGDGAGMPFRRAAGSAGCRREGGSRASDGCLPSFAAACPSLEAGVPGTVTPGQP